ncbi:hypothetical protein MCNF_32180 [Mycolicibacterium confluentis]|uniref:Uncharacterized protein n=1 Tax=Mycolicibacterium confluentis TaxID=28047 RepID=A0A7I7Y0B8_9MYCO|nr:hypothetical protein MCNF_32180 [Mycolicibacterium confluentis]
MIGGNPTFSDVASKCACFRLSIGTAGSSPVSYENGLGRIECAGGLTGDYFNPVRREHKQDDSYTPRMPGFIRSVRFPAPQHAHAAPATLILGGAALADCRPKW